MLNPLLWLHLRVNGPPRNIAWVVGLFFGAIVVFAGMCYYMADRQSWTTVDANWMGIISALQGLLLLLMTPSAIRKAVQRDFDSGMIESHRLTPMSNLKIVLGYLAGAPIQPLLLYAASLVIGSFFAARLSAGPGAKLMSTASAVVAGWFFSHGCLLVLALLFASLTLLFAMSSRGKANLIGVAVLIGFVGGWSLLSLVPGLALITGLMGFGGIFNALSARTRTGVDASAIVIAALLQFLFAMIFIRAACTRLRAPDRPLFSLPLALALLLLTGLTLVAGVGLAPRYEWLFDEWRRFEAVQLICSTGAFMLVGLFTLIAAAAATLHARRAAAFGETAPRRERWAAACGPFVLTALTAVVIQALVRFQGERLEADVRGHLLDAGRFALVALALLGGFLFDQNVIYAFLARRRKLLWPLTLLVVLFKGGPLLVDGVVSSMDEDLPELELPTGYVSALSPLGALSSSGSTLILCPIAQAVLAAMAIAWARRPVGAARVTTRPPPHSGGPPPGKPAPHGQAAAGGRF